uniref:Uncharacterized protein n=1 Tax=Ovis aries TaxID=9940 RepID=A0AC11ES58_SHEEP
RPERLEGGLGRGCFSPAPSGGRIRCQGPPSVIFPSFSSHWHWGLCPQGGTQRGWRSRGSECDQLGKCPPPFGSRILNFLATGLRNVLRRQGFYSNGAFPGSPLSSLPPQLPNPPSPRPVKGLVRPLRLPSCRVAQDFDTSARGMSSTLARNEEKKGSRPSQPTTPATSLGCNLKVSRSEEFLTQISTELTDEALFVAAYHMNPVPIKEKQTQDRGTQISKHVFFTKTRGTDTR